jgi:hypothetical protein
MPKGNPLPKEEVDARRKTSRRLWREKDALKEDSKEKQWRENNKEEIAARKKAWNEKETAKKEYRNRERILNLLFARLERDNKPFVHWTVEQEDALFAKCENLCALCDEKARPLALQIVDSNFPFSIENAVPVCFPCQSDLWLKDLVLLPKRLVKFVAIKDLPAGYNRQFLASICISEAVKVHVVARTRKNDFVAAIGYPLSLQEIKREKRGINSYNQEMTCSPAQVLGFGERLFEVEARALFPEYKDLRYRNHDNKHCKITSRKSG